LRSLYAENFAGIVQGSSEFRANELDDLYPTLSIEYLPVNRFNVQGRSKDDLLRIRIYSIKGSLYLDVNGSVIDNCEDRRLDPEFLGTYLHEGNPEFIDPHSLYDERVEILALYDDLVLSIL
jgi:hypothetical protein